MDLTLFILRCSFIYRGFFAPFLDKAAGKIFGTHTEIFIFPLLPKDGEIKDKLAFTVSNPQKKRFKAKYYLMMHEGKHSTNVFNALACFREIRVVNHKTDWRLLMIAAYPDFVPYLIGKVIKDFTPVKCLIIGKPVKNILFAAKEAA